MEQGRKTDLHSLSGTRRRVGFVALLWWIAAVTGTIGLLQGLPAGWIRKLFIGISWLFALLFSYVWWQVRKGRASE